MKMNNTKKLSEILNGGGNSLRDAWDTTEAASDFAPLPPATYTARIIGGELTTAKTGTPGYKLTFKVLEGELTGRQFWHDIWLTPAALPMAKRDLGKIGVTVLSQLENPLPPGIRCAAKLILRKDDDGTEHNRVRSFEVFGVDKLEDDDFAPAPLPTGGTPPPAEPLGDTKAANEKSEDDAFPKGGMFAESPAPIRSALGGGL